MRKKIIIIAYSPNKHEFIEIGGKINGLHTIK